MPPYTGRNASIHTQACLHTQARIRQHTSKNASVHKQKQLHTQARMPPYTAERLYTQAKLLPPYTSNKSLHTQEKVTPCTSIHEQINTCTHSRRRTSVHNKTCHHKRTKPNDIGDKANGATNASVHEKNISIPPYTGDNASIRERQRLHTQAKHVIHASRSDPPARANRAAIAAERLHTQAKARTTFLAAVPGAHAAHWQTRHNKETTEKKGEQRAEKKNKQV